MKRRLLRTAVALGWAGLVVEVRTAWRFLHPLCDCACHEHDPYDDGTAIVHPSRCCPAQVGPTVGW